MAAAILPIALACLLVAVRGVLDRSDLALLMVLAIVAVATSGDRVAAAIAAVSAAASFDFFLFTRPYGSRRVDSAPDIETTLILLGIGLAVGQISIVGREDAGGTRAGPGRSSAGSSTSRRASRPTPGSRRSSR